MTINDIFKFLNQPIVLTLLSLVLGGYLLNIVSESRSRKNTIRDKSINFLVQTGENINDVSSRLFGHINREDSQVNKNDILKEKTTHLITTRMGVKILSEAYLKQKDFFAKYEFIVWELYRIRETLASIDSASEKEEIEKIITKVKDKNKSLAETWLLKDEKINQAGNPPYNDIFIWTQMIVNRAADLLSTALKSAVR